MTTSNSIKVNAEGRRALRLGAELSGTFMEYFKICRRVEWLVEIVVIAKVLHLDIRGLPQVNVAFAIQ
jgi:hypothetical protein